MANEPYSRQEYAGALVANAAAKPFNLGLAIATIGAATLLSVSFLLALVVGLVIYAIASPRLNGFAAALATSAPAYSWRL